MSIIDIIPKDITTTNTITKIKIEVESIELNTKAKFRVFLFSDDNLVKIEYVELTNNDYENWGNDDNYIINYILTQLGLSPYQVV